MGLPVEKKVGANVRAAREARKWSLADLAGRIGLSRQWVHKAEVEGVVLVRHVYACAAAFGVPPSDLLPSVHVGPPATGQRVAVEACSAQNIHTRKVNKRVLNRRRAAESRGIASRKGASR